MSWFRVDDSFADHPKLEELEDDWEAHALAVAAWTLLGADSSKRGTDGLITPVRIAKVLACWPEAKREKACAALVKCGLWKKVRVSPSVTSNGEVTPDYRYHDWSDYQPTKDQRDAERAAARERQKNWKARKRAGLRPTNHGADAVSNATGNAVTNAVENAAPSRPVPSRPVDLDRSPRSHQVEVLPVGPVDPSSSVRFREAKSLLIRGYQRRYQAAKGDAWMSWAANDREIDRVAAHCSSGDKPTSTRVDAVLDGMFADPWMCERGWPWAKAAKDPGLFENPPKPRSITRNGTPEAEWKPGFAKAPTAETYDPRVHGEPTDLDEACESLWDAYVNRSSDPERWKRAERWMSDGRPSTKRGAA